VKLLLLLLLSACTHTTPVETLTEFARVLEATKSAYYITCIQLVTRSPEQDARCLLADVHINTAIDLYMDLRGQYQGPVSRAAKCLVQ